MYSCALAVVWECTEGRQTSLLGEEQQQRSVSCSEGGERGKISLCVHGACRAEACSVSAVAQPLVVVIPSLCVIPGL